MNLVGSRFRTAFQEVLTILPGLFLNCWCSGLTGREKDKSSFGLAFTSYGISWDIFLQTSAIMWIWPHDMTFVNSSVQTMWSCFSPSFQFPVEFGGMSRTFSSWKRAGMLVSSSLFTVFPPPPSSNLHLRICGVKQDTSWIVLLCAEVERSQKKTFPNLRSFGK